MIKGQKQDSNTALNTVKVRFYGHPVSDNGFGNSGKDERCDPLKHKIRIKAPVERRRPFVGRKTAMEARTVWVDGKACTKTQKEQGNKPYSLEELIFYDEVFDD